MKKSRILALVLAVSVMMMGAGYAYWTETLEIKNTVKTGELDVIFTAPHIATEDTYMGQEPLNGSYCNVNSDTHKLDIFLNEVYPGAQSEVTFTLQNSGTLAAYVDEFAFKTGGNATDDEKNLILCNKIETGLTEGSLSDFGFDGGTLEEALTALSAGNGIFLEDEFNPSGEDKLVVKLYLQIDPNANDTEDSPLYLDEGDTFDFFIGANVYQYNDNVNLDLE